ncbi:hypothetical protein J2X69_002075 [Algoriphagus sp. 4150]|uniref:putative glycolipid-binding domain-containing protein n=1 Tax=Algoriphagus sp. 4150 TaxID=2817756 RepID=UPI00285810DA|nr:putative glycolipid-binding domain-containing protein [Algoriphagus sp. 4150]MDR7129730.1 hypothetical protein [Algoriphagus sp. 4150]
MENNILWSGIEYYSLENCIVDNISDSVIINSVIIGVYLEKIYRVEYDIILDRNWRTKSCQIKSQINKEIKIYELLQEKNRWFVNGRSHPEFNDCFDIDISLTPLTNSLPINRLKLNIGQEKKVNVIYIDLMDNTIKHVKQKYRRISTGIYKYENIPNDFEAEIKVDDAGFVVDYPQLFERKIRVQN